MNCKICNSINLNLKYKRVPGYKINKSFSIIECLNCGVCFTSPFLNSSQYKQYHKAHQVAFNGAGRERDIEKYLDNKESAWLGLGYENRLKIISEIKPDVKRVLDIGCGAGLFLDYLKNKGFIVEGIELSPWGYEIAKYKLGLNIKNELIENLSPPSKKFDVITLYDVIEHTTNPNNFLQVLRKWLKKDGVVIINVPNINSAISNSTKELWNKLCPPDHTFHFSQESISYLLNRNGYRPISIKTNSGDPGESLSQLVVGFWVKASRYSKKASIALSKLNKPLGRNGSMLVRIIKGSRKTAYNLGPAIKPVLRYWNKKNKGEGLNIICRLY